MPVKFTAIPSKDARHFQAGGTDIYGNVPERVISDGTSNPCRHCLRDVPKGAEMLILAYRPFDGLHAYAETGPIFLCASECDRFEGAGVPQVLMTSPDYLIKGYSVDERIVYGTGAIVPKSEVSARAAAIFEDARVAWVDVRSARNNCFQARITRA